MDKRLLGLGVLVLTIVPGYLASHMRAATDAAAIEAHVKAAATRYAVSEHLVTAVIEVESHFNPRAVSRRGAQGLMQLMPATSASLGVRDAFDPRANIDGGVRHLRWLMDRFGNDLPTALAAYNAGERAVTMNRGAPPSRETRDYVRRVLSLMRHNQARN
jgi:soluble lytic murein transglycosylase-like protein